VFITQGESEAPADVRYLGRHVVHDVPPAANGIAIVDIEYRYDASGTVKVSARMQGTGEALQVSVEALPEDVPGRFCGPVVETVPQHVCAYFAFDLSGSMSGAPLTEARKAARSLLKNTDLAHCSLGIIAFSDDVRPKLTASQNAS
jgi:molecular chaperone DnaK